MSGAVVHIKSAADWALSVPLGTARCAALGMAVGRAGDGASRGDRS